MFSEIIINAYRTSTAWYLFRTATTWQNELENVLPEAATQYRLGIRKLYQHSIAANEPHCDAADVLSRQVSALDDGEEKKSAELPSVRMRPRRPEESRIGESPASSAAKQVTAGVKHGRIAPSNPLSPPPAPGDANSHPDSVGLPIPARRKTRDIMSPPDPPPSRRPPLAVQKPHAPNLKGLLRPLDRDKPVRKSILFSSRLCFARILSPWCTENTEKGIPVWDLF